MPNHPIGTMFLFFSFLLTPCICIAQVEKGRISGIVSDSTERKPISFVTVSLFNKNQPAQQVKAAFSDAKGKFQLSGIDSGNYVIIFSHTGFTEKKQNIRLKDNIELGELTLSRIAKTMKDIQVFGVKPLVEQQDDKVIFNVENDPDSKTALMLDIFRKTPFLTVDGDDNVLMNGKTDFKVLLNGRETSLFARNAKEALKSFPGTLVSRIEIITTPPAKYDAEGIGGIINIITKKKVEGYNGSVSTFNRTGAKQNNLNFNFNVKRDKIGFALFYFANGYDNLKSKSVAETVNKTGSSYSKRIVDDKRISENFFNGFNSEISWQIDSLRTMSAYGNMNGGNGENFADRISNTEYPSSATLTNFQEIENTFSNPSSSLGADFIRKYSNNKDKELSVRVYGEFGKNKVTDESRLTNAGQYRSVINKSVNEDNQYIIQSDYILPLMKNRKLELGVKLTFRNASSDFQSHVKAGSMTDYYLDSNNSDYFRYSQDIYSAYGTYSFKTKKSTFRIGSRAEFTRVDGNFVSLKSNVKQEYANVVPFFQVITKLNSRYTFVMTYNQRLRRPYIWNLNPFVNNIDSLDISYGNPNLGPETLHFFTPELRYQKGSTFAGVGFQLLYTNNYITEYAFFDPSTGITKRTSDHLGKGFGYRFNANLNTAITPKLNINTNGFIVWNINRVREHPEYNSDGFGYGINGGFNYKITPKITWVGNFNLNQNPALIQYRYPLNSWYMTMLAFKLFKDKFNMSIRTTNFLRHERNYKFISEDELFRTTRVVTRPVRGIVLTTNWNFGKLKENVSKKKGVNNDDLIKTAEDAN